MNAIITHFRAIFKIQNHPLGQVGNLPNSLERGEKVALLQEKVASARRLVENFFLVLVFIISVLTAFFVGRTHKFMENRPAFYFESLEQEEKYQQQVVSEEKEKLFSNFSRAEGAAEKSKMIVASKGGKKYYYVWCSGAGNIKEANKRYFADEAAAEKAGYTKAASCK